MMWRTSYKPFPIILRQIRVASPWKRHKSSDTVLTRFDERSKVFTLSLNKPPVNSLSVDFMRMLVKNLEEISQHQDARGLIVSSNLSNVFCAGLDLKSIYAREKKDIKQLLLSLQELSEVLFKFPLPTVAAINGHAIAGGALLAIMADFRVMLANPGLPRYKIGLNETKFGMVATPLLFSVYKAILGHRLAERHLKLGTLFSAEEALHFALIDETSSSEFDLDLKSQKIIEQFCENSSPSQFSAKKANCRKDIVSQIQNQDWDQLVELLSGKDIQSVLGMYIESLNSRVSAP